MNATQESIEEVLAEPFALAQLAADCNSAVALPDETYAATRRTLLDTIGVAAAGATTDGGQASKRAALEIWGHGHSTIWFSTARVTSAGAAFVNASYAAALDLDDGHRQASGHPAAAVVPAVLAIAEQLGSSASRVLTATAIGYEVAVRVSAARDITRLRTTDTGLWCGVGVAAAAAWLLGASTSVMTHALSIAGQTATAQLATGWTRLGHTVKEGIPWATANGLQAVSLAAAGHRGPIDILDDMTTYDRQRLLGAFGETWAIESAYFKLYSCCRWGHAAIDGAVALAARMHLRPDDIDVVLVETFDRALTLPNQAAPQSVEAAQYSIPFCVALALVHGPGSLLPMTETYLGDANVIALAERIRLVSRDAYRDAFPATTPARVTISAEGKVETIEILLPKGEPQNPLSSLERQNKFQRLAAEASLCQPQIDALIQAASSLGIYRSPEELFAALRPAS